MAGEGGSGLAEHFRKLWATIPDHVVEDRKAEQEAHNRATALKDWQAVCPPRVQDNDWAHPGLRATQTQIKAVLGWQRGGAGIYGAGRDSMNIVDHPGHDAGVFNRQGIKPPDCPSEM